MSAAGQIDWWGDLWKNSKKTWVWMKNYVGLCQESIGFSGFFVWNVMNWPHGNDSIIRAVVIAHTCPAKMVGSTMPLKPSYGFGTSIHRRKTVTEHMSSIWIFVYHIHIKTNHGKKPLEDSKLDLSSSQFDMLNLNTAHHFPNCLFGWTRTHQVDPKILDLGGCWT